MSKKIIIIFIVGILVVAIGAYFGGYRLGYQKGYDEGKEIGRTAAQVGAAETVTNPMEKMPSVNPFEEVVNPFKELYKNPFK